MPKGARKRSANKAAADRWRELRTDWLYREFSARTITRGAKLLTGGKVADLRLTQKEADAAVHGNRVSPYRAKIFWPRGADPWGDCDCPAFSRQGHCEHYAALALTLFRLLQGKGFGFAEPAPKVLKRLATAIKRTDAGGSNGTGAADSRPGGGLPPGTKTALVLAGDPEAALLRVRIEGRVPRGYLHGMGIVLSRDFRSGEEIREFPVPFPDRRLARHLEYAARSGIPVFADTGSGPVRVSGGEIESVRTTVSFGNRNGEIDWRLSYPDGAAWETLGGSGYVLDPATGRLGRLEPGFGTGLTAPFVEGRDQGFSGSGPVRESFFPAGRVSPRADRRRFAEYSSLVPAGQVPAEQWRSLLPDADDHPPPVEEPGIVLRASRDEKEGRVFAGLFFESGDERIPARILLGVPAAVIVGAADPSLLGAKGRVRTLVAKWTEALEAGSDEEAEAVFARLAGLPEFRRRGFADGLTSLLRETIDLRGELAPSHEFLVPRGDGGWALWKVSFPRLVAIAMELHDPKTRDEIGGLMTGCFAPLAEEGDFLRRCHATAEKHGIPLYYRGKKVRRETVRIEAEVRERPGGWFDLDARVTCGALSIPPEEWTRLMRGEGGLREEEDGWIALHLKTPAALESLAVFRSRGETETGDPPPVRRLEIFEVLEMRKAGAEVRLPPDWEQICASLANLRKLPRSAPPKGLRADLRKYQLTGYRWVRFLHEHRFGACLADDMGLGKTVQAIAFLEWLRGEGRLDGAALLVVPPGLAYNWIAEIRRFAPDLRVREYAGRGRDLSARAEADVLLASYDVVRLDIASLEEIDFPVVVFDEAHALKNPNSARTRAVARLRRKFTLCLTGTPVENNPAEFYSVLSAAVPGLWPGLNAFKEGYRRDPGAVVGRARPFLLRRTKKAILKELPRKVESDQFLDLTEAQKEIYTRTVGEVREEVLRAYETEDPARAGIKALAALMRLRQVCVAPSLLGASASGGSPKVKRLAEMVEEAISEGDSALVFSQFLGALDLAEAEFGRRDVRYFRLDGKTSRKAREERIAAFQEGESSAAFLISLKAGGVGLNLTRANYVFHLDPWWNPAVENQASDRAHRIGQNRTVFVERLLMRGTIEERMMDLKRQKAELFRELVEDPGRPRGGGGALDRKDFEFLLG